MQKITSQELYDQINQNLGSDENWYSQGFNSPYVLTDQEDLFITKNYIGIIQNFGRLCNHYLKNNCDGAGFEALLSYLNGKDSGRIRGITDKIFKQMNFPDQIEFLQRISLIHGGLEQISSAYYMGFFEQLEHNNTVIADFTKLNGLERNVLADTLCQHLNTMFHNEKIKILTTSYAFQSLYSICLNHKIQIDSEHLKNIPECARHKAIFESVLSHFVDKVLISQNQSQPIKFDMANYMIKDFVENFQTLSSDNLLQMVKNVLKEKKQDKSQIISAGDNLFLSKLKDAHDLFLNQIKDIEKWESSLSLMMDVRRKYGTSLNP